MMMMNDGAWLTGRLRSKNKADDDNAETEKYVRDDGGGREDGLWFTVLLPQQL